MKKDVRDKMKNTEWQRVSERQKDRTQYKKDDNQSPRNRIQPVVMMVIGPRLGHRSMNERFPCFLGLEGLYESAALGQTDSLCIYIVCA